MKNSKSVKMKIGIYLIVISIVMPLLGFVIPFLSLPMSISAALIGVSVVGGPEVCFIVGVALAGKESIDAVKNRMFKPAGKLRYYIGLWLFVVCIFCNWVMAYLTVTGIIVINIHSYLYVMMTFDLLSIFSILLLGSEFFYKIRSIFKWEGQAK